MIECPYCKGPAHGGLFTITEVRDGDFRTVFQGECTNAFMAGVARAANDLTGNPITVTQGKPPTGRLIAELPAKEPIRR